MSIWILFILSICIFNVQSIHLLQTLIYNEEKYLGAIQGIHDKFKSDLLKIKNDLQKFKSDLKATEGNDTERVKLLRKGLIHENNQLIQLEGYLKLPYGLKACRCKGFTSDLKSIVNSNMQTVSLSIQKMKDGMVQWPNCKLANELRSQVSRQEQYLAGMKEIVNSDCHRPPKSFLPDQATGLVNLNESKYISNLQKGKWIFGTIAPSDFKYQMFSLSSKSNITKCPEQTPFTKDGQNCISCPVNNPIWSVGDSICTTCGVGQHYNVHGHNCSTGSAASQQQQAKIKGIGFYGSKQIGVGYNRNRHGTNYINIPPDIDPDLKTCSLNEPFFNGNTCVSCQLPQIFNFGTLSCQNCPSGTIYNIKRKLCSSQAEAKHVTNLNSKNLVLGIDKPLSTYLQQQQKKLSQNSEFSICPEKTPYFDGQTCITCSGTKPYFNLYSQQCQNCDPGFSYFQDLNNCTINIYLTNSNTKGLIQSQNYTIASIYEQASVLKKNNPYNRLQICPNNKPFSKNFVCINCSEKTPLFDLYKQQCTSCQDQTFYDSHTSKCIGYHITNPQAPNLYFKGISRQQYFEEYQSLRNRFTNIQDCPRQAPYFDGSRCVSCAQSTPVFSIKTRMCGQCPIGKVYSQQNGDCVAQ